MGFYYLINFDQRISKTMNWKLENHYTSIFIKVSVTLFWKYLLLAMPCLSSWTNTSSWTARVGCLGGGPLYFIEAVERYLKEKQKLVIRGEIPAIWPAILGDREMSAVYETSGRVSVLFAPTAHVKEKSDSSLNPLWTSLTASVIWNAHPPPRSELLSCFTKRPASDGDLVPLQYVTERW